jgi:flagellar biosynthetic protein FlhB
VSEERSEKATPRRRSRARERGSLPRSRDLSGAVAVCILVLLVAAGIPRLFPLWRNLLVSLLDQATAGVPVATVLQAAAVATVQLAGPLMAAAWLVALAALLAQGGLVVSAAPLEFDLGRLNPALHLGQLFSVAGLGRMLRSLLPFAATAYLAFAVLAREWNALTHACWLGPQALAALAGSVLFELAWKAALVWLVWSLADYGLERWRYERSLRMTRQEVLDELKDLEGNPTLRARIRRLRRQLRRRWKLQDVRQATVVVTNPDHLAVALAYRPLQMLAPTVVAKGRNRLAERIIEVARWAEVPVVENRPLARALYRTTEVGQSIAPGLYRAVAELLAYVYRAEKRLRATAELAETQP